MLRDKRYQEYIISCITVDDYDFDECSAPQTDTEKLQFLYNTFVSEYGFNIKRYGIQKAVAEWLSGLPSVITLDFYNCDIIERAQQYGSLKADATEAETDRLLARYWVFMSMQILKMWRRYKIGE